jgi:hypothetical protein
MSINNLTNQVSLQKTFLRQNNQQLQQKNSEFDNTSFKDTFSLSFKGNFPTKKDHESEISDILSNAKTPEGKDRFDGYEMAHLRKRCTSGKKEALKSLLKANVDTFLLEPEERPSTDAENIGAVLKNFTPGQEDILDSLLSITDAGGKTKLKADQIGSMLTNCTPDKKEPFFKALELIKTYDFSVSQIKKIIFMTFSAAARKHIL